MPVMNGVRSLKYSKKMHCDLRKHEKSKSYLDCNVFYMGLFSSKDIVQAHFFRAGQSTILINVSHDWILYFSRWDVDVLTL